MLSFRFGILFTLKSWTVVHRVVQKPSFLSNWKIDGRHKIGVIFMPFSNPTCHFRATADFTSSTYSTYGLSTVRSTGFNIWATHILSRERNDLRLIDLYRSGYIDGTHFSYMWWDLEFCIWTLTWLQYWNGEKKNVWCAQEHSINTTLGWLIYNFSNF